MLVYHDVLPIFTMNIGMSPWILMVSRIMDLVERKWVNLYRTCRRFDGGTC